jgi:hypothetical protein
LRIYAGILLEYLLLLFDVLLRMAQILTPIAATQSFSINEKSQ